MKIRIAVALLLLTTATRLFATDSAGGETTVFNEERPLVYEDAWDLWPYCYLNDEGKPVGFNIDLLELLCKQMHIPYVVRLKPTAEALSDLKAGRSDLMMGMAAKFHDDYAHYSNTIIQLFTHSVVYPKSKPQEVKRIADLATHRVIVHGGSFSHHLMEDNGWGKNAVAYDDMKEAVFVASRQENLPIVWNTLSLKWLIHNLKIENLAIAPIDIMPGEYRFMSNNHELLQRIDRAYTELQAHDKIQPIQNKWFYPERTDTAIATWVWYVAAVLGVLLLFCLCYYYFLHKKEQQMTLLTRKANHRFSLMLQASNVQLFTYTVNSRTFGVIGPEGQVIRKYSSEELYTFMPEKSTEDTKEVIRQIVNGEIERKKFTVQASTIEKNGYKDFIADISVLRRDSSGKPAVLVATRSDISELRRRQLKTQDTMRRYQAIFNTPMVDMVYYNEQGLVADINQKGCDTFGMTKEEMIADPSPIYERIGMDEEWFRTFDNFRATLNVRGKQYELQLTPVTDNEGRRIGIYGTGLDVTEMRQAFNDQQRSVKELEAVNTKIKSYIENINYALQMGGVRIVTYSPDTHLLKFFSDIDKAQYTFTQSRCIRLCQTAWASQAGRIFDSMDSRIDKPQMVEIRTVLKADKGAPLFLTFNFIPTHDATGQVVNYFGICRDVSEMRVTQEQLSAETVKMQEVEAVKNAFLHNMSFEIRTPLATVVGFSELFNMPHSDEEELIFVREIKESSRSLLVLVNNILFLSRLDAKMIEIQPQPVDLAKVFDALCADGWREHQVDGVNYVVDNPYTCLVVSVDITNLGVIISQIVANAAQHTAKGSVRTRYDYSGSALTIAVNDTGAGIPDESQKHIFERFVTSANAGAGLGLSICYELTQLMGGTINIMSKLGRGTTVWVSIPCQVIEYERK